jgi:phosphopantothenoylcysteine decarboxylase/phosphopantothenate--cysteine ligase
MWQNPATVANIATLRSRGITIIGPGVGQLTGTDSGPGRMVEPEDIASAAFALVRPNDLASVTVVVTAGGTREPLDPVRYIGNRSSGRQGVAIAEAAAARGATVTLIAANLEVSVPRGIHTVKVSSTLELEGAVSYAAGDANVVIMAAAVADYRPETVVEHKIKKEQQGERLTLELVKNPDILASLVTNRTDASQIIVGFAAETEPDDAALLALGTAKIARKGSDYLVVNRVGWNEGFATTENTVMMLASGGAVVMKKSGSKAAVADALLDVVAAHLTAKPAAAPHTFTQTTFN